MKKTLKVMSLALVALMMGVVLVSPVAADNSQPNTPPYLVEVVNEGVGGTLTFNTQTNGDQTVPEPTTTTSISYAATIVADESLTVYANPREGYEVYSILINREEYKPSDRNEYILEDHKYFLPAELIAKSELVGEDNVSDNTEYDAAICVKFRKIGTDPDTGDAILILPLAALALASVGAVIYISKKKVEA